MDKTVFTVLRYAKLRFNTSLNAARISREDFICWQL